MTVPSGRAGQLREPGHLQQPGPPSQSFSPVPRRAAIRTEHSSVDQSCAAAAPNSEVSWPTVSNRAPRSAHWTAISTSEQCSPATTPAAWQVSMMVDRKAMSPHQCTCARSRQRAAVPQGNPGQRALRDAPQSPRGIELVRMDAVTADIEDGLACRGSAMRSRPGPSAVVGGTQLPLLESRSTLRPCSSCKGRLLWS